MTRVTKTVLTLSMVVTPQARATIGRALRPPDFELVWTANPSEAVEASARHRADLVVLDMSEPLLRGWGILAQMRSANPSVPVVVLTEHKSDYDAIIPQHAGAVLQKPVEAADLADAVNSLLKAGAAGAGPEASRDAASGLVIAESERFRAMLLQRYHAPLTVPPSYRHWGINE